MKKKKKIKIVFFNLHRNGNQEEKGTGEKGKKDSV